MNKPTQQAQWQQRIQARCDEFAVYLARQPELSPSAGNEGQQPSAAERCAHLDRLLMSLTPPSDDATAPDWRHDDDTPSVPMLRDIAVRLCDPELHPDSIARLCHLALCWTRKDAVALTALMQYMLAYRRFAMDHGHLFTAEGYAALVAQLMLRGLRHDTQHAANALIPAEALQSALVSLMT